MAATSQGKASGLLLEICVDDIAGLEATIVGGADRIELCSALGSGGLTPSYGFMAVAAKAPIPVHALIRPRAGHFTYSIDEIAVMEADIHAAREAGLAGVVIGAITDTATLDIDAIRRLIKAADGLDLTLHRAIDVVADMDVALDLAIELGFSRVLTSGGARHAEQGLAVIERLARHGAGRISIMPGGGVRPENAAHFLAVPEIRELHASCSQSYSGQDRLVDLGFEDQSVRRTDADTVRRLKASMDMRSS
ncbi:copper homeostasis protein [Agrobacterium albertimagni AOL15]|uniref:PF03932 family protein CutC n=1 Tax=Agrobacterium albertimagni AOL15 TaxID=1156935 RepID=K2QAJ2_9HYPH|nr:copper homeostasis protein CutC [Agrobacterium albertimagni]EKF60879.1 copper homeostasis protein [Agrobacterium albertimagni AOL15]